MRAVTSGGLREPHIALVHDNFSGPTGMGHVLEHHADWILDAGWTLTVIGDNVPPHVLSRARVVAALGSRGLPSLPAHLAWCVRARLALRTVRADIVHVHAPLLAGHADLLTSHHMAQPAYDRGVRDLRTGVQGALRTAQGEADRRLDDRLYRRRSRMPPISFVSEFLRDEYRSHYGEPRGGWILPPPAPPWRPVGSVERDAARQRFGVRRDAIAVGYVGGSDQRKGYGQLEQLYGRDDIDVLPAGLGSERLRFGARVGLGFVDVARGIELVDVVVAPTIFDSAPVAVLQALARGVPVVLTPTCGWAAAVERHGAGVVWTGEDPLADAVMSAARCSPAGCERLTTEFSPQSQRDRLLDVYRQIARRPAPG